MKKLHPLQLTCGLLAAFSFALAAGCNGPATEDTTSTAAEGQADDHDHDHGEDGHEHGDHEHGDHDHSAGKEGDHQHGDHNHGDHGHAHGDHDHDFKTLDEATAEIETLAAEIDKHLSAGDVDAAHDPLHHIGAVLIATEQLIKEMDDAKLEDSEQKTEWSAAVTSLLDDFTEVDEHLHGGDSKEASDEQAVKQYESVQASIKEAIATLKKE